MDETAGNTTTLTRAELPDDTIEIFEAVGADLRLLPGRHFLRIEFNNGRFMQAEHVEILTRSALSVHDQERLERAGG